MINFNLLELDWRDESFINIIKDLQSHEGLRCRQTDRLHIAVAINHKMQFFTYDKDIKGDYNTIKQFYKDFSLYDE